MERTGAILYAGKGGVEKTTMAASTDCRSAELSYRALVPRTAAARFIVNSFSISLGNRLQLIAPNLWTEETSKPQTLNTCWGTAQQWMTNSSYILDYYHSK
jgi:anion-transporting  ArsA/GET3 family ATPase